MSASPTDEPSPDDPGDSPDVLEDGTLGGYLRIHERPPAFEGSDGHPYTVSVEVEKVGDLRAPFAAYLVFPRWAVNGLGIVGHLQTPLLGRGGTRSEATEEVEALGLPRVKDLLEEAIERRGDADVRWRPVRRPPDDAADGE